VSKYTRRELLETGLAGSLAIGVCGGLVRISAQSKNGASAIVAASETEESALLRKVMDEIIPAVDSMPAASEVGGIDYLNRLMSGDRAIAEKLRIGLAAVEKVSRVHFSAPFVSLKSEQRIEVLTALAASDRARFGSLRDYVYEAYYTNERVWKLVGYANYPSTDAGPHMIAFDEQMLANVKKRPKLYREI
jgi:hypothetical protein